ncbi:hypothetical protein GCM10009551_042410 [Nocardiopsis tropica]
MRITLLNKWVLGGLWVLHRGCPVAAVSPSPGPGSPPRRSRSRAVSERYTGSTGRDARSS